MHRTRKILALLLVVSMILSMIPTAFAAEDPIVKAPEEAAEALSVTAALPAYKIEGNSYAERAVDLVSRMTLTEKAYQTAGYDAPAIPRLGVATYMWWNEALHGYNQRGWFGMQTDGTSYPSSYSMGASFDKDLYYQEAVQIGAEIRERVDDNRYNLSMFSPNINLARDPRWGRNDESYGEDPFLVGTMASQFVNGIEGKTQDGEYIKLNANGEGMKQAGTTIKHYAANNSEKNRYTSGADDVTIREMREYYTRAARIVIKNADVSSVMMAYSSVSGIPISYSSYYMDTILRQSYGFSGYIVSDCDSIATSFGRNVHKNNPHTGENYTKGQAYANAMANGLDLQCNAGETDQLGSYGDNYELMLGEKTDKGIFTEAQFEVSAARLMYKRMQFGEFDADNYYADQGAARLAAGNAGEYVNGATGQTQERIDLADETSRSTVVLLKNEDNALPVTAEEITAAEDTYDVAIVGSNAQSSFLGGYSSRMGTNGSKNVVTIEKAIKTAFADADFLGEDAAAKTSVTFYSKTEDVPENVDLAVVAIGEGQGDSREDGDRMNINMKEAQLAMFEEVLAKDPAKLVVVMETYGQIQMPDTVLENADAILWSGFNGIRKGTGFGEAITGKNNPSGRMNATWLKDAIGDTPDFFTYTIFPDEEGNGGRSYMYNVEETLWPFGYGLSYSDIDYAPVEGKTSILGASDKGARSYSRITKDTVMDVTFQMTNTNGVAGKQVAEVYVVSPGAGKNNLPLKRLVGFDKVFVPADGTVTVSIPVNVTDFAFFNEAKDCYELPTGEWQIWVAKSSEFNPETDLCESFTVSNGNIVEDPTVVTVKPTLASDAAIGVTERVIFPLSANAEDNIIYPNVGVTMANEKLYGTRVINNVPGWDIGVDAKAVREYTLGTEAGFTVPDTAKFVDRLETGKLESELPMVGTKFELPANYVVSFESNKPEVVEVIAGQLVMQAPGTATITATVTGPTGASASTEFSVCVTGSKALTGLSIGGNAVEDFDPAIYAYFVDLPEGFEANDAAALVAAEAVEGAVVEYSVDGVKFAASDDGINPATVPGMVYVRVSGEDIAPLTYSVMFGDVDNGCEHNYVVSKIVEPTCLTDGYTSNVCTKCYKMTKTDIVPALGHNFVNGRCTRCYVKDPAVQAVDAAFVKADTIEPGKQYVVVAKASGKALVNAGAVILGEDVTVEGGLVVSEVAPDMVWTVAENGTGYFLSCGTEGLLSHGASSGGMFGGGNAPLVTNAYTAETIGTGSDATWALQNGSLVSRSTGGFFATGYVPVYNADKAIFEAASGMDFSWGGGESALVTLMKGNPFEFYEVAPYMTKTVELNNAGYVTSIVYTGAEINATPVKTLLELDVDDFEIEGQTIYSVFAEKGKLQLNVYPFKAEDVVVNYVGDLDLDLSIDGDYETANAKVLRPKVSYTVQTLDAPLHAGPNICIDPASPTGYTVKFLFKAPEKAAIAQMEGRTIVGWTYEDVESVQFNGDLALRNANDFSDTTVKQPEEYEPGWMRAGSVQAEMTKLTEGEWAGYWYYELPLAAGANQYWFYCNGSTGKWYPDPANPAVWGPGCTATYNEDGIITRRAYNSLYVPYDAKQDYELLELRAKYETPRTDKYAGTLTWELIEGEDMDRTISVYLPYNYDANREEPYKTIYMTPAYDQDEADWFGIGSCQNIMDNLIANGDVDPDAIIVSVVAARDNKVLGLEDLDGDDIWEFGPLFDIVIPYIEENYNVSTEGADRAIGGHYQTAGSLIRFLGNTEGRSIEEFGYYLMVSTGKGADIDDVYDGASWNGNDVIVPADEVVKGRYFFSNGSTEGKLNMGTLPQSGAKYIYYQPPGGHDFNCWDQAAREYFKALWNDEAWAMLMTDIYFNKAAFADRYEVVNQASAQVTDAGLTLPSSTNRFETEKRADVVEIPVEGDNWTATVKFTCTNAGFGWGNPTENFVFLVGDDYDATLGLRGTTASTKGYLNGADAGEAGSGFKANNAKYYRIQKVGDTFICSVSDNDFDYEVVYTAEDTGIVGNKLYIDAYNTSSWAFGAARYNLQYLSFADPCDHEVETEIVEPTCTEDGYTIFSCAICGKSYKGNIVPAAHKKWATDKGVVTAPTCTEAGYTTYVCTECGESFNESGAAALGHDWIAGEVIAPTCVDGGYTEYSCSRCDATKQDDKLAATGHIWDEGKITLEPTEDEFGAKVYTCTVDGCEGVKEVKILPTTLAEGPTVIADPESPTGYTVKFVYKNENAKSVTFAGDIGLKNDADLSDSKQYTPFEYKPGLMRSGSFTDAMVECDGGYWFYEVPLAGGANQYWFYVDGNTNYMVPDPVNAPYWSPNSAANKNAYNAVYVPYDAEKQNYEPLRLRAEAENPKNGSSFLIPENYEDAEKYEMGTWSYVNVPSLGANYYVGVYLPYGYDADREEPYKTIYICHGGGQDESDWVGIGSVQNIMDNLAAAGRTEPAVIIAPNINAINTNSYKPLLTDVIPFVEENYNVSTDKMDRAMAGLSMGGMATMSVINSNPVDAEGNPIEKFGYFGPWSGGNSVKAGFAGQEYAHILFAGGHSDFGNMSESSVTALADQGIYCKYVGVTGAHDFNTWCQMFRIFLEEYLWNPAAFGDGMEDIDFADAADADKYEIEAQVSAALNEGTGVTLPSSTGKFEDAKRADIVQIPVGGDNWTATVKFTCTSAGFAWGKPTENFLFLVGDSYSKAVGLRGTTASTKGYLNGKDAGQTGSGFKANNVKYYRIQRIGDTFICSVSDNDFIYDVVYTAEATGIVGKKLYIDAYNTSSWSFGGGARYNLQFLSFADPCDHEIKAETVAPTCTTDGYTTFSCDKCGKSYVGDIVPAQHKKWEGDNGVVTAPTCTEAGYVSFECAICKEIFTEPGEPALGHDWIAGEVIAPTCVDGGYTEYSCSRCDATKQDDKTAALGHSWDEGEVTLEATETEFGAKVYTCTVDGCEGTKEVKILPTTLAEGPTVIADPESPTGYTVKFVYKNENAKSVTFAGDIGLKNDADLSDSKQYTPFEYKPGLMRSGSFTDAMVECDGGYWFYEVPLAGGANQYWFYVDGNTNYMVPDPVNAPYWSPNSAANKNAYNAVYVPYDEKQDYEPMKLRAEAENPKNGSNFLVPPNYEDAAKNKMGTWSYVNVPSLGENYYVGVYLPYGYDAERAEPYKTIYICHGGGQDESDWVGIGSVQNIMDNLAAAGRTEPAVIIAPNINAINTNSYKPLLTDIVPFVEENYNVSTDKMDRAMAGLSMGGMATMSVINSNPVDAEGNPIEKFGYFGPWSGGNSVKAGFAGQEYAHILFAGGHSDFGNMSESSVTALADQGVYCKYVGVTGAHDFNTWNQMFRIWLTDYLWKPASVGDTRMIDDLMNGPIVVADPESPTGYTAKFMYFDDSGNTIYFNGDIGLKPADYTSKQATVTPFEYESGMMRVDGFKDEMINLGGGYWYYELPLAAGANQYWFTTSKNSSYMIPDPLNHPDWSPASNWSRKNAYNAIYVPYDAEKQNDEATGARAIENPRTGKAVNPTREERKDPELAERYQLGTWDYVPYSVGGKDFYMGVYLPYGYDENREEPYKTVYVLHGGGQDESDWLGIGSVQNIIDNLAAEGQIEDAPVLIVPGTGSNRLRNENLEATFAFVEENYNVSSDRMDRAICGLSMGAMQVNSIIGDDKKRDEPSFGYYGPFSGGAPSNALTSQHLKDMYLYVGNGTAERKMNMSAYEDAGAYYYYTQKSGAHNFNTWNQLFTEFVRDFIWQPAAFGDRITADGLRPGPNVIKDENSPTGYTVKFLYENETAETVTFAGDIGLRNYADPTDETQYTPFDYQPGFMRSGSFTAEMTKRDDGFWYYEVPLAAGANQYWFYVDGGRRMMPDPNNHPKWSPNSKWDTKSAYNAVYVPYDEKQNYEPMAERAAELPRTDGKSGSWSYVPIEINGTTKYMGVYTPYGYKANGDVTYKTIYAIHGGGQDESDWMGIGSVQKIMDNLIAEGRTEPAIVVTPASSYMSSSAFGYDFANFFEVILPYVEEHYKVSTDPQDRAFLGLSAGGGQTRMMINNFGDQFGYYGPFSSSNTNDGYEAAQNLENAHILFGCGCYDPLVQRHVTQATINELRDKGANVASVEVAGAHDFNAWCQLFRIFAEDYLWNPAAFEMSAEEIFEYVRDAKAAVAAAKKAAEEAQAAAEAAQAAAEAAAAEAAEDKAAAEAAQAAAEAAKAAAEAAQAKAESAQAAAEAAKAAAEAADADAAKKAAEAAASAAKAAASEAAAAASAADAAKAQAAATAAQKAAETAQAAAEEAEKNAAADAEAAAAAKKAAEDAQAAAEAAKAAAEAADADAAQKAAESAAAAADAAISAAAAAKAAAEAQDAEAAAKAAQAAAEAAKADAEAAKAAAEAARKAAEEAAAEAGMDRDAAEAAKAAAELAQSRAEVAQKAAEAAQAAAEAANAEAAANAAKTAADAAKTAADAAEAAKAMVAAQAAQARAEAAEAAAQAARLKAEEAAAKGEDAAAEAAESAAAAEAAEEAAIAARKAAEAAAKAAAESNAAAAEAAAQAAKDAAAVAEALKEVAAAKAQIAADKAELEAEIEAHRAAMEAAEKAVKDAELRAARYYALTELALAATDVDASEDIIKAAQAAIEAAASADEVDKALADAMKALDAYCPSAPFIDAPAKTNWAHAGIDYCIEKGYMNGTSEGIFSPNATVTRAQLVTILYRVAGEPAAEFKGTFEDVADGKFYSAAVEWAAASGVVKGVSETRFNPDGKITREQIAAILYRYAGEPAVTGDLSAFPDAGAVSNYAVDAMIWAVGEDLINGIASGEAASLAPKNNATRAQIAAIIMRFLKK